jgi:hypothetical protein
MYKNVDFKASYNPLHEESDDILGLYENDLDTPLSDSSLHDYNPSDSDDTPRIKSEPRESVAWFKRPVNPAEIPESMNFDEVESIMWRKVHSYIMQKLCILVSMFDQIISDCPALYSSNITSLFYLLLIF